MGCRASERGRGSAGAAGRWTLVLFLAFWAAELSAQTREIQISADRTGPAAEGGFERPPVVVDHVQVAVRDLDQARNRYQYKLGLALSQPRRQGFLQALSVELADGAFLELVAAVEGDDPLADFYRRFLARGEGPTYVALDAGPVEEVARRLGDAGFQTSIVRGEGEALLTVDSGSFGHLLFVHSSDGRRARPVRTRHAIGAEGIAAVWIDSPDFASEMRLYGVLGLEPLALVRLPALARSAVLLPLASGALYLLDRNDDRQRPIRGLTLGVDNLSESRETMALEDEALHWLHDRRGRSLTLRQRHTHGFFLELLDPDPR